MDLTDYLSRIRFTGPAAADEASLRALHRAHMFAVPFENLDIGLGRAIHLTGTALWEKIIARRRGGFCYELNGLFAQLLTTIGFEVDHLNARVYKTGDAPGIDFGHLALRVSLPGKSWAWLADVGFGDSFVEPLRFEDRGEQVQGLRAYRIEPVDHGYTLWQRDYSGAWERRYYFDPTPRRFPEDFQAACRYHQTSPDSTFTRGSLISLATPEGRVTLEPGRLIVTRRGTREETPVGNETEYQALLKNRFGVVLDE